MARYLLHHRHDPGECGVVPGTGHQQWRRENGNECNYGRT